MIITKYICDRCGIGLNSQLLRKVTYKHISAKREYHLCSDCASKLKKFLNGEEENENEC